MRGIATPLAAALLLAAPARAQTTVASADRPGRALAATGSPSNATATVSPSTVPQALERADQPRDALSLSLGAQFAGGDFGVDADTRLRSVALGARLRRGPWRLSASIPWLRIESDAVLATGIDSTPVLLAPASPTGRGVAKGLGDLTLGAAYAFEPDDAPVEVELSGRVKFPTASGSSGLSTGETDYALGAQVSGTMGRVSPFASVTYRFLGDTDVYDLRDGFAASAGFTVPLGTRALFLASYHYARAATRLVDDSHELFAGASTALGDGGFRLTGFVTAGLSDGAPSASGGLALSRAF